MEFSLAQLTVLNASPSETARIAAEAGFDYFSLRQIYMGLPEEPDFDLSKNRKLFLEVKGIMKETGIQLLDIELARVVKDLDVKKYEPAFQVACELGGKCVLSSIWTDDRDYYIDKFAEICELAMQYGLTVELEYVPIASVRTLSETVEVIKGAHCENAGILIDIHHFHRAKDTVEALDALPQSWFHMAHICDAKNEIPSDLKEMTRILREDRDYFGEGGIDVASIVSHLPSVPLSIELPKLNAVKKIGYLGHAKQCLKSAKKYFNLN